MSLRTFHAIDNSTKSRKDNALFTDSHARFTVIAPERETLERFLTADPFSLATAFIRGEFTVQGDLFSAIRFFRSRKQSSGWQRWYTLVARLRLVLDWLVSGSNSSRRNVSFHYDRSNEFYQQFLDSRMVYSCGRFDSPDASLEHAQVTKLHQVCEALDLRPGERLLDLGCGWGGLVIYAADQFHVNAVGCTLSHNQFEYARHLVRERKLEKRVTILENDYRDVRGRFDKIASIGMFEHVGVSCLGEYFRKVHTLLEESGLFLNSGIVRPETISDDAETYFLQTSVFPGSHLVHLSGIIKTAERVGFLPLAMQNLRRDYALTCRAWFARLQSNSESCLHLVDDLTYRTWLLYLAASAVSFEDALSDVVQQTFAKTPKSSAYA